VQYGLKFKATSEDCQEEKTSGAMSALARFRSFNTIGSYRKLAALIDPALGHVVPKSISKQMPIGQPGSENEVHVYHPNPLSSGG
jgi:hypothetical protein